MRAEAKGHTRMNVKSDAAQLMILVLKAALEGLEKHAGCCKHARALMHVCACMCAWTECIEGVEKAHILPVEAQPTFAS